MTKRYLTVMNFANVFLYCYTYRMDNLVDTEQFIQL